MRKTITARVITAAGVVAASVLISGATGYALHSSSPRGQLVKVAPRRPTEDSCTVDYRDGAWHITPVVP